MKTPWVAVSACFLVTACVSSGPESQLGKEDKATKRIQMSRTSDCVFQRTIEDFDAISDNYVVLYGMGRRKAYLAEISGGCFDVKNRSSFIVVRECPSYDSRVFFPSCSSCAPAEGGRTATPPAAIRHPRHSNRRRSGYPTMRSSTSSPASVWVPFDSG